MGPVVATEGVLGAGEPVPRGSENVDVGVNVCFDFGEPSQPVRASATHSKLSTLRRRVCPICMAESVAQSDRSCARRPQAAARPS